MAELWGQVNLAQGGAVAVLAVVFLLVVFGRLVPLRQLEALRKDKNEQLAEVRAERDTWRAAAQSEAVARQTLQAQTAESLELSRTAVHLLTAMPLPSANGVTASAVVQPASPAP